MGFRRSGAVDSRQSWFFFHFLRQKDQRERERAMRGVISHNIVELTNIFENINNRADKLTDDEHGAESVSNYFMRNQYRMELLRLNIENTMAHLNPKDNFTKRIKAILDVERWLVETYHDPTHNRNTRLQTWMDTNLDLEKQVGVAIRTAHDLDIIKPVVID